MTNRIILGLGSNYNEKENILRATEALKHIFPDMIFSDMVYTKPIGLINKKLFLNRVGVAYSSYDILKINRELKRIESELGRMPQDKEQGCIKIDIDLLQWNEEILKPGDFKREDVIQGLRSIL